jgi:phosphoserine phosphatase
MHYALVFSTSKLPVLDSSPTNNDDASTWLSDLTSFFAFLYPDGKATWLDNGCAAEIICHPSASFAAAHINKDAAFQTLRNAAAARQLDVNIVPAIGRRKKLLIADMDSTIITSESLDDLAEMAGIGEEIAAITKRSIMGEIDFEDALVERVAMLRGHPSKLFDALIAKVEPTSGANTLVQTMRANGAKCYLVSGGFDFITEPIATLCGFQAHHANHLDVDDGKIVGTLKMPVLDREAKASYLAHYCKIHGIGANEAAAIGDGANDLAMLQAAGMGVAFASKPILRDRITIQLNYSDLRGLLYLQGYHKDDFIFGQTKIQKVD